MSDELLTTDIINTWKMDKTNDMFIKKTLKFHFKTNNYVLNVD